MGTPRKTGSPDKFCKEIQRHQNGAHFIDRIDDSNARIARTERRMKKSRLFRVRFDSYTICGTVIHLQAEAVDERDHTQLSVVFCWRTRNPKSTPFG
jgi:polynucleotide 5'-kinase involved in rRNA processing